MKTFTYKILNPLGEKISGNIEAISKEEAIHILQDKNMQVISVVEGREIDIKKVLNMSIGGIALNDKLLFIKQFNIMVASGLPITEIFDILINQTKGSIKQIIENVKKDIQNGSKLTDTFRKNKGIFSEVQLSLLKAGESSGNLSNILSKISMDMERSVGFTKKVKSAFTYPAIIFVVCIGVVWVLSVYLLPSIEKLMLQLSAGKNTKLPEATQILINFSKFINPVSGPGTYILLFILIAFIIGWKFYRRSSDGLYITDNIKKHIPIMGNITRKLDQSEFCSILAMLLDSGTDIIEGLEITANAMTNEVDKKSVQNLIIDVQRGIPLNVSMSRHSETFDDILIKMVAIGEKTGKLDKILTDMAKYYETEVNDLTQSITKLLEPIVLLIVGVLVMFLVIAVYLPIVQISDITSLK